MSGSSPYPQPVTVGLSPPKGEGSKAVPVRITWDLDQTERKINLLQAFQTGQFTTVQAVYVDNTTCSQEVLITSIETGQAVRVPAFTSGIYPLICAIAPLISVALSNAFLSFPLVGTTRLFFLNREYSYYETKTDQNADGFSSIILTNNDLNTAGVRVFGSLPNYLLYIGYIGLAIFTQTGYAGVFAGTVGIDVRQNGVLTGTMFRDFFTTITAAGVMYDKSFDYPTLIAQRSAGDGLYLFISDLPPATASISYILTMSFALRLVQ